MKYRKFGHSGLYTSILSVGGWKNFGIRLNEKETDSIIRYAVDNGVTTFDTADVYGPAEAAMGKVFSQLNRDNLVICTKCYWPMSDNVNDRGLSRKHIRASVTNSLKQLQTNYIDIFLCHRYDNNTPLQETIRTFNDLIREGKILYWGTSAWTAEQLIAAYDICERMGYEPPILEQAEYSLLERAYVEKHLSPLVESKGLGLMCWSPLASGILAGKNLTNQIPSSSLIGNYSQQMRDKYHNTANLEKAKQLQVLSMEADVPMATLALSWLISRNIVSNIAIGVSSLEQIQSNIVACQYELPADLTYAVEEIFIA
ncbi:aldo/keto reductase [Thalassotalea fusca]